ncbi:hypothetical protein L289_4041 [Acinetobacter gerneri DSM 14967 = CIP 107464 = MTCC 9824]|nr:hypothetical protein L289_4041 [Acinetobacter gerneri DSM 14967 = CIP 107464 = MTCC 9824]
MFFDVCFTVISVSDYILYLCFKGDFPFYRDFKIPFKTAY